MLERYRDRFADLGKRLGFAPVAWHEPAESRAATAAKRCAEEGAALLKLARDADTIIALDERGKALTSPAFAQLLGKIRDDGAGTLAILIGGPDGLGAGGARRRPHQALVRRHDAAARPRPHRAGRAALPRRHHTGRAPVSSGVRGDDDDAGPYPVIASPADYAGLVSHRCLKSSKFVACPAIMFFLFSTGRFAPSQFTLKLSRVREASTASIS